eukprot:4173492-Pyramimonas_sp.AAC.1
MMRIHERSPVAVLAAAARRGPPRCLGAGAPASLLLRLAIAEGAAPKTLRACAARGSEPRRTAARAPPRALRPARGVRMAFSA